MDSLDQITEALREFADRRNWCQHHEPRKLAVALQVEAAELLECYLWDQTPDPDRVEDELADVFIYLVRLADVSGVDLLDAARRKMFANSFRFPVPQ